MPLELDGAAPDAAVLCFFQEVLESARGARRGTPGRPPRERDRTQPALRRRRRRRAEVLVVHPGVGAPLAAGMLEEVIALGCTRIVACGGAGALRDDLVLGHAVVVDEAVRDEGTSFHYLAPSRTVDRRPARRRRSSRRCSPSAASPTSSGKSWTTDAFYREARPRIDRRVAEGCLTVEMEAAAFMAVARFRGVRSPSCSTPATPSPARPGRSGAGTARARSARRCSDSPSRRPSGSRSPASRHGDGLGEVLGARPRSSSRLPCRSAGTTGMRRP